MQDLLQPVMSNSLTALWVGEATKICQALRADRPKRLGFLSVLDKREVTAPAALPAASRRPWHSRVWHSTRLDQKPELRGEGGHDSEMTQQECPRRALLWFYCREMKRKEERRGCSGKTACGRRGGGEMQPCPTRAGWHMMYPGPMK